MLEYTKMQIVCLMIVLYISYDYYRENKIKETTIVLSEAIESE